MNKYIPVKKALQIKKTCEKNIPVFDSIATLHPKGVQCTLHSVCTVYEKVIKNKKSHFSDKLC